MPLSGGGSGVEEVAVAKEVGIGFSVGFDINGVKDGHVVRSVGVVGNVAESHFFALGAVHRSGFV